MVQILTCNVQWVCRLLLVWWRPITGFNWCKQSQNVGVLVQKQEIGIVKKWSWFQRVKAMKLYCKNLCEKKQIHVPCDTFCSNTYPAERTMKLSMAECMDWVNLSLRNKISDSTQRINQCSLIFKRIMKCVIFWSALDWHNYTKVL